MKKTLFAILALCSLSFGQTTIFPKTTVFPKTTIFGRATGPTVVQSGSCSAPTSCTITFGSAVTAGDYILCYVGTNANGWGCAMTGETLTALTGTSGCSSNVGDDGNCFLSSSAVGGQTVVTCTLPAGGGDCAAAEITSPSGGHAKDAGGNAQAVTPTVSVATSAGTTNAGDICFGMAYTPPSGGYTIGSGWTSVVNATLANGSILLESQLPGVTGTVTATATAPAGSNNVPSGVLCLKP